MQDKFKFKNAHISGCHIFAEFTVFEVCFGDGANKDATALPKSEHVTFQRGAGGKVQEKFKFENAHISVCHIFADFTVVEVGGAANVDEDTTPLPKKARV